jgi:hypothetical protein
MLTLEKLIELKLASGMTASDRLRDLADVQELVKIKRRPAAYAERFSPLRSRKISGVVERGGGGCSPRRRRPKRTIVSDS